MFLRDYPEWNNDRDVVFAAVQEDGTALQFASTELRSDKEIVMTAIQQWCGYALQYASDELKNDKEVVMTAVQQYGEVLQDASDKLKGDKDVVMAAVQQSGLVLEYASKELRNDKDVLMAAVQKDGWTLRFTSEELKCDKEVVILAVKNWRGACDYSLLEGYKDFDEIIEKEGELFLFSCWNNRNYETRLQVANHPNFLPTLEQIEIGMSDSDNEVRQIYQLRKDEWLAKIEDNKLRNAI